MAPVPVLEVQPSTAGGLGAAMGTEGALVIPRLERGCRAFTVCLDDSVAAYGWVSAGPEWIGEIRLELRPGPGEAYVWNCFTLDPHRRRGLFRSLLVHLAGRFRSEGTGRLWIAAGGGGATPALPAAGFVPVLDLRERRLGPVRRIVATAAAGAEPEAVAAARRALGLDSWRPRAVPPARVH